MNYDNLFKVETKFIKGPIEIKNDELSFEELNKLSRGEFKGMQLPITFKVISGTKWTPVLKQPTVGLLVIRKDVINKLNINKITGFKSFNVLILEKDGKIIDDYFGFAITGKCGKIDFKKSKILERKTKVGFIKYYIGLFPNMETWDRTDIFRPDSSLFVIMNKKTKEIFDDFENNILDFTPLEQVATMGVIVD